MGIKWHFRVNFKTWQFNTGDKFEFELVLPSLIGSLLEAAHSTISETEEFRFCTSLPIEP